MQIANSDIFPGCRRRERTPRRILACIRTEFDII